MKLRRMIKSGIAHALHWARVDDARFYPVLTNVPLVLGYHRVVENFNDGAANSMGSMLVSTETFEKHLDWIGRRYDFVSLDDLAESLEGGIHFRRPVAAVTFDDGYSDVYHNALPVLMRKGIPAGVFVVSDLVGTNRLQLHDELYQLLSQAYSAWTAPKETLATLVEALEIKGTDVPAIRKGAANPYEALRYLLPSCRQDDMRRLVECLRNNFYVADAVREEHLPMTWQMLREMQVSGITIGSHTSTHALLTNEEMPRVVAELTRSREDLERNLGAPVKHFAYPDGRFNLDVVAAVREAGYRSAYTICLHRAAAQPMMTIPRRMLWETSGKDANGEFSGPLMSCQVSGIFDLVRGCSQEHGL